MRIALLTESYAPVVNGVSTSVRTLAELLRAAGHDPIVVAPRFPGYTDDGPIPVFRVPSWTTRFNPSNPFAYPSVGPWARQLAPVEADLIHTNHPFGLGLAGAAAARRRGIPHVTTFHTLYHDYTHYFPVFPQAISQGFLSWYLSRFYRRADAVLVPSRAAGKRLTAIGVPEARLEVVPTGVAPATPVSADDTRAVRRRHGIPDDAPLLLYVGRIAREKNLPLLFDAFARQGPDAWLALVGGGPDAEALKEQAQSRGIGARTVFVGAVPRETLPPYYAAATLFAFPSATETQGIVLTEAQGYGLPCVAVDGGGAPEFVRNGVDAFVTPSALDPFADAIKRLLTDPDLRATMGAAARTSPLALAPEGMAQKVLSVYAQARAARRSAAY